MISACQSVRYRGHAPDQSRGNLPTKTKIVLALPSYNRQRLSVIRRGWCPFRTLYPRDRRGGPFRRRRSSPPVVECAVSIGGGRPSQAKQQQKKRLCRLRNPASAKAPLPPPGGKPSWSNPCQNPILPGYYLEEAPSQVDPPSISKLEVYQPTLSSPMGSPSGHRRRFGCGSMEASMVDGRSTQHAILHSVLVVIIIVAVCLVGRIMWLAALIVPELSIHAVGRKQLCMRAAFDRPAA